MSLTPSSLTLCMEPHVSGTRGGGSVPVVSHDMLRGSIGARGPEPEGLHHPWDTGSVLGLLPQTGGDVLGLGVMAWGHPSMRGCPCPGGDGTGTSRYQGTSSSWGGTGTGEGATGGPRVAAHSPVPGEERGHRGAAPGGRPPLRGASRRQGASLAGAVPGPCRSPSPRPPPVPSILPVPGTHISSRRPGRPPRSWPRRSPARHGPARPPPSGSGPSAPPPSRTTPPTAGGAGRTTAGAAGGGRDPPGSELPPMPGVPRAPPGEAPRSPCAPRPVRHGGTAGAGPFPGDVSRPGGRFWPPQDPPHPLQDPRSPVVRPHPTRTPCPRVPATAAGTRWGHWAPAKCEPLGAAWAGRGRGRNEEVKETKGLFRMERSLLSARLVAGDPRCQAGGFVVTPLSCCRRHHAEPGLHPEPCQGVCHPKAPPGSSPATSLSCPRLGISLPWWLSTEEGEEQKMTPHLGC